MMQRFLACGPRFHSTWVPSYDHFSTSQDIEGRLFGRLLYPKPDIGINVLSTILALI